MRNKFYFILSLLLLFAGNFKIYSQITEENYQYTLEVIKTIPAPGPNCEGLTWDGNYLWVSDIVNDSIYRIDTSDGTIVHKIPTSPANHLFEGLAWDGNYLWASHYETITLSNPKITKIDPLSGNALWNIVPYSGTCWPHGIAWDGQYLWVNDFRSKKIRKIDPFSGIGLDSIPCPGNNGSIGLAWFNNHLFTGDFNTDSIYQIDPVTKQVVNQWACPYTNPRDMEFDGEYFWFVAYEIAKIYKMKLIITDVETQENLLVQDFYLYQNYPNPFNPSTMISWQSPVGSWQTIKVYDVLGNEVATLVDEYKPAGKYEVEFNLAQSAAADIPAIASGVYFYQLKIADPEINSGQGFIQTKKMILLR
ncbi:T9SS type A sorting domain-containing protein [Ignavibacterium album]|uniref:T9SS type A sorting domain-containing protein n=1 Tax=Ignavibacterium album TaxID=591197 RepID=UPI0026E99946|nr:T9SS type A sorting domain-containing protein [Ignavibacterium album]